MTEADDSEIDGDLGFSSVTSDPDLNMLSRRCQV
jgi:hypothetical protein